MSDILPYLLELRRRVLYCLVVASILFIALSFYANRIYHGLALPLLNKLPTGSSLIATQITASFSVPLKFCFILSIILVAPYVLFHVWRFVAPALYKNEKQMMWFWFVASIFLFYSGILFAYYVALPLMFKFFVSITPPGVELKPDITAYLDFSLQSLFAFGWAFEAPILILALVWFEITSLQQLTAIRRYIVLVAFTLAMLLTPPDVLSQCLLAVPLYLLYELGVLLAKILIRNRR